MATRAEHNVVQKSLPGEAFWFQGGHRRVGIILHLVGVIFGGLLAVLQFTPVIRHKFILFHRICGYLAIALYLMGNAGAFMIMDQSIGGTPAMRVWIGALGTATTISILNALINIKRLQIDQHRAWMIRTWAWAANIITLRLLLLAGKHVVDVYGIEIVTLIRCDEIFFMYANNAGLPPSRNPTALIHPQCGANAATNTAQIAVSSIGAGPENSAAALRPIFLMAAWLAIIIHILLAELYLGLTPAENYRLRVVSYEKQVARGMRDAGSTVEAGLGSSRIGDAPKWWALPLLSYTLPSPGEPKAVPGSVAPANTKQAKMAGHLSDDSDSTKRSGR